MRHGQWRSARGDADRGTTTWICGMSHRGSDGESCRTIRVEHYGTRHVTIKADQDQEWEFARSYRDAHYEG